MKAPEYRKAVGFALLGVVALLASCAAGSFFPRDEGSVLVVFGFVAFVLCGRRAMELWQVDEIVFEHSTARDRRRPAMVGALTAGIALGTFGPVAPGEGARPGPELPQSPADVRRFEETRPAAAVVSRPDRFRRPVDRGPAKNL